MIVLDSAFLIKIIRKHPGSIEILEELDQIPLYTTIINVYEIWYGFFKNKKINNDPKWNKEIKNRIENLLKKILILDLTKINVEVCAEIGGTLTRMGQDIGDKYSIITGIMKVNGLKKIITGNTEHFKRVDGIIPISETLSRKKIIEIIEKN